MTDLTIPTDEKPSRIHKPASAFDDVFDSLREYERLARVADRGFTIESTFTADAVKWVTVWLASEPPAAVRTVVVRDGVTTEEYRSWAEARPADDEGRARWDANPSTFLRAFTERAALRRAFADVIVGRDRDLVAAGREVGVLSTETVRRLAQGIAGAAFPFDGSDPDTVIEARRRTVDAVVSVPSEAAVMPVALETAVMPAPRPRPTPRRDPRPEPRPPRPKAPTAIEAALREAEAASGKTISRRSSSRAQRDSGKRRGGRS